jgi:hypothetical protein
MKRTREIEEEKEVFNGNNIYKKSKSLNITLDKIDLCNLPINILNVIIIQETILLEKYILRFVCKKLHDIIHRISYSSSILKYDSENFDEFEAKYENVDIFKWVVSTFCTVESSEVCSNVARYSGNIQLIKYANSIGYSLGDSICHDAAGGGHFETLRAALARNTKMGQRK